MAPLGAASRGRDPSGDEPKSHQLWCRSGDKRKSHQRPSASVLYGFSAPATAWSSLQFCSKSTSSRSYSYQHRSVSLIHSNCGYQHLIQTKSPVNGPTWTSHSHLGFQSSPQPASHVWYKLMLYYINLPLDFSLESCACVTCRKDLVLLPLSQ
jgi:hypothetical protein